MGLHMHMHTCKAGNDEGDNYIDNVADGVDDNDDHNDGAWVLLSLCTFAHVCMCALSHW